MVALTYGVVRAFQVIENTLYLNSEKAGGCATLILVHTPSTHFGFATPQ
jgi:hypothetical protein